jgi:hypothetical protein
MTHQPLLADGGRSQLPHLEQMGLILPDLLGPELVGRLVKVRRELADDPDVGFCGTMGVITALEFFQHLFAKLGHRDLLNFCDPTLTQPLLIADSRARGSVRRASGFVQISISLVTKRLQV